MINLEDIEKIKQGDLSESAKVFDINLGYVNSLFGRYSVKVEFYDDFVQLAYLAMLKAAQVFDTERATISAFNYLWRIYIEKEYLDFRLNQFYSMRVSRGTFTKLNEGLELNKSILAYAGLYEVRDKLAEDMFFDVELAMAKNMLWGEVKGSLSSREFYIITAFYRYGMTLDELASKFSVPKSVIKYRKRVAIEKLRKNRRIRLLARDYYNYSLY